MRTLIAGAYIIYAVRIGIVGHVDLFQGFLIAFGIVMCVLQDLAELKRNLKE